MKFLRTLTLLLVTMSSFATAAESNLRISCETFSCYDFNHLDKFQKFRDQRGSDCNSFAHHITVVRLEHIASAEKEFEFVIVRPVMATEHQVRVEKFATKSLLKTAKLTKESLPIYTISSAGFLPGEKIGIIARSKNYQSQPIMFIPNPIIVKSSKDKANITAELATRSPAMYNVRFSGFNEKEKVKFKSVSLGEVMCDIIEVNKGVGAVYSPEAEGAKGGTSKVSYTRPSGEQFTIHFPWGEESVEHHMGMRGPAVLEFLPIKVW